MPSPHWTPTPAATEVDWRETVPDGVSAADAAATRQKVSTIRARKCIVRYAWSMIRSFRTRYQQTVQAECYRGGRAGEYLCATSLTSGAKKGYKGSTEPSTDVRERSVSESLIKQGVSPLRAAAARRFFKTWGAPHAIPGCT